MKMPIAGTYGWKSGDVEHSHSYLLPVVLKHLREVTPSSVLDIGTGNGATLPVWQAEGWQVAAMEPDRAGFEFASRNAGFDVRQLGVGDPLPEEWRGQFDAVICLEVVEHLFSPVQLPQTIEQALRPGGVAVVSTPYHGYLKNLALALAGKWDFHHHPLRDGGHIKFWSRRTLTLLFESASFTVRAFEGAGRLPGLWKSMILVVQKPALGSPSIDG